MGERGEEGRDDVHVMELSVTNTIQLTMALSSEFKMKKFTTSQLNDSCITDKLTRLMPGL